MNHAEKLAEALRLLLRSYPTDSDLIEADWDPHDIDKAMDAHEQAKRALAAYERTL